MPLVYLADSCPLTRAILIRFMHESAIEAKPLGHAKEIVTALTQAGVYSSTEDVVLIIDLESINCGGINLIQVARRMPVSRRLRIMGITFSRPQNQLSDMRKVGIDALLLKEELSRSTFINQLQPLLKPISLEASTAATPNTKNTAPDVRTQQPSDEIIKPLTAAEFDQAVVSVATARTVKPVVHEVLRIASDQRSDATDLVNAIRVDASLTAKVVGASNTAFYKRAGGEVKNLQDAVTLIGVKGVQELAISLNVSEEINDSSLDPVLRMPKLWGHSLATAHLAEWIATATDVCDPGQAYVAGMLHDFGRRLMTWQLPQHYKMVLTSSEHLNQSLLDRERQIVGLDHAILASRVMERWGCPPFLVRSIALHHSQLIWDKKASEKIYDLVRVLRVADAFAIAFGFEADETDDLPTIPLQWLCDTFLDPEDECKRMCGTLMERIGLLVGRSNYSIELPTPWKGRVEQFVMFGARPMQLEPLQATLLRSNMNAKVVSPAKADLSQKSTMIVIDWRGMDMTDCLSSVSWLANKMEVAHWPMLIVGYPAGMRLESLQILNKNIYKLTGIITPATLQQAMTKLLENKTPTSMPAALAA